MAKWPCCHPFPVGFQCKLIPGSECLDDRLWTCQRPKYALKGAVNILVFKLCRYFFHINHGNWGRFPFWQACLFKWFYVPPSWAASVASWNVCQLVPKVANLIAWKRNKTSFTECPTICKSESNKFNQLKSSSKRGWMLSCPTVISYYCWSNYPPPTYLTPIRNKGLRRPY